MAAPSKRANVLVTFDVDGTILGSQKHKLGTSAHKQAINYAVKEIYGIDVTVDGVEHAGSTDREIVRRMCVKGGLDDDACFAAIERVVALSCARIPDLIEDDLSKLVLPGVRDLLAALTERRAYVGMVTGNFNKIGWAKMESAGLHEFLAEKLDKPSAFGSDCADRSDILALAVQRAEAQGFVKEVDPETSAVTNVFHIGDVSRPRKDAMLLWLLSDTSLLVC